MLTSYGTGIAVDAEGHAYVTGVALTSDFPTTPGAYRTAACPNVYPFAGDGFVAKLSVDGGALLYSTLLCGQGDDSPSGIAIDAAGNAYVVGTTASSDFRLVDPIELSRGGGVIGLSGFVSKLSPDGSQLLYSTYLGGSGKRRDQTAIRVPSTTACRVEGACRRPRRASLASRARAGAPACDGQRLPGSIARACSLFDDAAGATDRTKAVKRLRRGVRALKDSIAAAAKGRKSGISRDCAGALKADLRDAKDRAERFLGTLRQSRR